MTRRTTANITSSARRGALFAVLVVAIWGGAGAQTVKTWTSGTTTVTLSPDGTLRVSGKEVIDDDNNPWRGDSSITGVVIDEGVTRIGSTAFANLSGLKSVTISISVKSIGDWAFGECTKLTSVTSLNPIPPVIEKVEGSVHRCFPKNAAIYVPAGSLRAYKRADGWGDFDRILPIGN